MKILILNIILLFANKGFSQKQSDSYSNVVFYYSNETEKQIKTKNLDSLQGIKISLDNPVFLDSFETYKNKRLNGPKKKFYSDGMTFDLEYKNGKLISERSFNLNNKVIYSVPLDIQKIEKCQVKFKSGRDYFDKSKEDTLIVINNSLPPYNRIISVTGALISRIDDNSYAIKIFKPNPDLKEIIITFDIHYGLDDNVALPRRDVIKFLAK